MVVYDHITQESYEIPEPEIGITGYMCKHIPMVSSYDYMNIVEKHKVLPDSDQDTYENRFKNSSLLERVLGWFKL